MNCEITSDYRFQELLSALNEGILEETFVKERLWEYAGEDAFLVHYSNGEYGIIATAPVSERSGRH
jgi:hypothetical protein